VAKAAAIIATIDLGGRPLSLSVRHSLHTAWVRTKGYLILGQRHVSASCCGIMHFMISIRLLVVIDYELRHDGSSFLGAGPTAREKRVPVDSL
jgi:hypothetical protein